MGENMLCQTLSTSVYENNTLENRHIQEDIKYFIYYVLFKSKWLIILVSLLGITATGLGLYLITPQYKASAKILVRSNVNQEVMLFQDLYSRSATVRDTIPANNVIEIASSQVIARTIVKQFKLDKKLKRKREQPQNFREKLKAFPHRIIDKIKILLQSFPNTGNAISGESPTADTAPVDYQSKAIKEFMEDMSEIQLVMESDIIHISIWGDSPHEAESIVKALTHLVIEQGMQMEQQAAIHGYEIAKKELEKARRELSIAEKNIEAFKQKWDISNIETQKEIKLSELDMIEKELISINAQIHSFRAKLSEEKKQLSSQKKNLASLQAQRELQNDIILLAVEIKSLESGERYYQKANATTKKEIAGLIDRERELTQLIREAALKEKLFEKLGKKYDELKVQSVSRLGGANLRIIDYPRLSTHMEPDFPRWELGLPIGVVCSIMVSIILAFLLELQNESFWTGSQVEGRLGIPLLGTIKRHHGKDNFLTFFNDQRS